MTANNQKAIELIAQSQELLRKADKDLLATDEQACENVEKYVQLREAILQKSISEFDEVYQKIRNCSFQDSKITHSNKELEDIKEHFFKEAPEIEPLDIPHISTAGFSSLIVGLFWGTLTFAIFIAVAIFMTESKINFDVMPTLQQVEPLLKLYASIVMPSNPTVTNGFLFIMAVSVFIGFIFALMRYHKRSKHNLHVAKKVHEVAQKQKVQKDIQNTKIMTLCEYTQKLDTIVYTLHVYLDEYNAILHRILHTEGDDFESYRLLSRKKVETAAILYGVITRIMNTDIVTADGTLNPLSRHALILAQERLEELSYGELSYREETPYVDSETINPVTEEIDEDMEIEEAEAISEETEDETKIQESENTKTVKDAKEDAKEDALVEILLDKKKED